MNTVIAKAQERVALCDRVLNYIAFAGLAGLITGIVATCVASHPHVALCHSIAYSGFGETVCAGSVGFVIWKIRQSADCHLPQITDEEEEEDDYL